MVSSPVDAGRREEEKTAAPSRRGWLRLVAILLGVLFVEGASFGLYWARLGHPFSWAEQEGCLAARAAGGGAMDLPGRAAQEHVELSPHPYRGVTHNPRTFEEVAEDGVLVLGGPVPLEHDPSRLVVGLFGGSMAWELGADEPRALQRALGELEALQGRSLTLVVAAVPADKQPSQLFALELLQLRGYRFDVVINLDGFNEIVNAASLASEGGSPLYPQYWSELLATFESPQFVARVGES